MSSLLNRRQWALMVAAAPALAQTTSTVPPQGSSAPASSSATPQAKLNKALTDVQNNSEKLAKMQVSMDVEPAFTFKA
jgi:hypothetical protein